MPQFNKLFIILVCTFILNAVSGASETSSLVKLSYTMLSDSQDGVDIDATGPSLIYERQISSDYFISYYASVSLLDVEASNGAITIDSANSTGFNAGLKFNLRLTELDSYSEGLENGMPYLRLGWERVKFDTTTQFRQLTNESLNDSKSGATFSFGYEKAVGEFGAFAEYTRHSNTWEDSSITVGGYLKF
ncbi:MAG: hypothetical protein VX619_01840 [bacterium]|nr:hypothetical protein [bacterium]